MIRLATLKDLKAIDALSERAIKKMHELNIYQWDLNYPRYQHFLKDIEQKCLFIYVQNEDILGVYAIYEENEQAYLEIPWFKDKSMVIHRFIVDPLNARKGVAKKMLYYALKRCIIHGVDSLKIDTHPGNYKMRSFLKKHQFIEGGYLKSIHRIGYERLIEFGKMNRILIFGSSGSGKTTLSKLLSEKLAIPYLHLDSIYWQKDWQAIDKNTFNHKVRSYLKTQSRFVIDGNYTNYPHFLERIHFSDTIILLDYPLELNLGGIVEREKKYKHRYRSDMATGCLENIDQEFLKYVSSFKPKQQRIRAIVEYFTGKKNILRFTSRHDLMDWLNEL